MYHSLDDTVPITLAKNRPNRLYLFITRTKFLYTYNTHFTNVSINGLLSPTPGTGGAGGGVGTVGESDASIRGG